MITQAIQIKEIIEPIPADKFQTHLYGHSPDAIIDPDLSVDIHNIGPEDNGKSCFIGHINRHINPELKGKGSTDGFGARQLTSKFLREKYDHYGDGASVNNRDDVNGYNEPEIKDRIMHMLNDMILAGY